MIIVIDGPAGAGKSSTAKAVAERASIQYLDSGAIYRAMALLYNENNRLRELFFDQLSRIKITCKYDNGLFRVFLNDRDVTGQIRTPDVNALVSEVAAMPEARQKVTEFLRDLVKTDDFIADGRDLGTAVFPDANLKFYLVADITKRAIRRVKEMSEEGVHAELSQVMANLLERDQMDASRMIAPLKKAEDAFEIDTSELTFEEQVDLITGYVQKLKI